MAAALENADTFLPLAAFLPKTRVWGLEGGKQTFIGASAWLSSTARWGCGYRCDGTAAGAPVQRYYASTYGRFNTTDPSMSGSGSGSPGDPGSWNTYSYAVGDPINRYDPSGLHYSDPVSDSGFCDASFSAADCFGTPFVAAGTHGGSYCDSGWDAFTSGLFAATPAGCGAYVAAVFLAAATDSRHSALPQCSVSLYERPVGVPLVGLAADHTYLLLQDPTGLSTVEGGPDLIDIPLGYLIGTVSTPPGNGLAGTNPGSSDNRRVGGAFSGALACGAVRSILNIESTYNNGGVWAKYDPIAALGYNSNSFTYTLLKDVGLSLYFGPTLGWTPGWGQVVPGLK